MRAATLTLIALLVGCEGFIEAGVDGNAIEDVTTEVAVPTDSASVADGAELYALYCETCHGPNAAGAATWPSPIAGYEPIHDIVQNGRGTMAAINITPGETNLIQAYLLSLGLPDWSALTGLELYAAACASCHGEDAEGSPRGPQLRFKDDPYFEYVTRHGGRADRFESKMEGYDSTRVSDAQLDEMMAWIDAFPNATTGGGLFDQFCANCHGGVGLSGRTEQVDDGSITGVCREGKEDSPSDRNYMPGWSTAELSDEEIGMLEAYIRAEL